MRPGGGHLAQVDLGLGYEYIRTLGTGAFGSVLQYRRHTAQGPEVSRAFMGWRNLLSGALDTLGYSVLRSCRSLPEPLVAAKRNEALALLQDVAVKLIARDECADFNLVSREVHSHRQLIHRKLHMARITCGCASHNAPKDLQSAFLTRPLLGANSTRHPLQAPRINARQAAPVHGKPLTGLPRNLRTCQPVTAVIVT